MNPDETRNFNEKNIAEFRDSGGRIKGTDLEVEIGTERRLASATVVPEPARTRIYAEQARRYPGFAGYEKKTARTIPVVALELERSPGELPADDPARSTVTSNADAPTARHISVVGDTYTVLVSGADTAGRYTLIDMWVPPGGGPPPHRHDFEEMFSILEGEIEISFRDQTMTAKEGDTVNVPSNAPHQFTNASDRPARDAAPFRAADCVPGASASSDRIGSAGPRIAGSCVAFVCSVTFGRASPVPRSTGGAPLAAMEHLPRFA